MAESKDVALDLAKGCKAESSKLSAIAITSHAAKSPNYMDNPGSQVFLAARGNHTVRDSRLQGCFRQPRCAGRLWQIVAMEKAARETLRTRVS
ncbi:hypothetical protein BHE74_00030854 [Ensete ventricosum]|nr:hypothetical protein GW17_00035928 [Ensete ventricosum]RWW62036.1 hypothetical protein BHE74_00030854 [Ensete ventricosum]RZS07118.1 hypothetical protein BHM03_00037894 [Ensete ventricosum]